MTTHKGLVKGSWAPNSSPTSCVLCNKVVASLRKSSKVKEQKERTVLDTSGRSLLAPWLKAWWELGCCSIFSKPGPKRGCYCSWTIVAPNITALTGKRLTVGPRGERWKNILFPQHYLMLLLYKYASISNSCALKKFWSHLLEYIHTSGHSNHVRAKLSSCHLRRGDKLLQLKPVPSCSQGYKG